MRLPVFQRRRTGDVSASYSAANNTDIAKLFYCKQQKADDIFKCQPACIYHNCKCAFNIFVLHKYGDDDPCNGFAAPPNKIYAVYNEQVQCIGFHEDAHLISFTINRPPCPAITEGLAMYFDRKWWGVQNMDWTGYYLKIGRYIGIDKMLSREGFFSEDCSITYPIMGAFTDWLISTYGIERYMGMYKQQNMAEAIPLVYQKTPEELNKEFVAYVQLFSIDEILEQRMGSLLNS